MPKVKMIAGLWGMPGDLTNAKKRIRCGADTQVVATLADALEQVRLLVRPLLLHSFQTQAQPNGRPTVMEEACR
jgi:hypothetical protein